jgi:hypothetical protein
LKKSKISMLLFFIVTCILYETLFTTFTHAAGVRYLNQMFTDNDILITNDIVYKGSLKLDIYRPNSSVDTLTNRPLLIYIHSGGFVAGDKGEGYGFAMDFAKCGYVVSSMNYTLGDANTCPPGVDTWNYLPIRDPGLVDQADAIAFLINNASTYGIDRTKIIVSGYSAGGVATGWLLYDTISKLNGRVANWQNIILAGINGSGNGPTQAQFNTGSTMPCLLIDGGSSDFMHQPILDFQAVLNAMGVRNQYMGFTTGHSLATFQTSYIIPWLYNNVLSPSGSGMVNDNGSGITYSGSWATSSGRGNGDYYDDVHYTVTNNDSFIFTFTGTGVDYITEKNSDEGQVDIYIDNVFQQTVDCTNAVRLSQQVVYNKRGLTNGTHTIKGVKKTGSYMLVDAFKVYSSTGPTPTPMPTPTSSASIPIPGTVEAENYSAMYGIQTEACSEGTLDVGWTDAGDWLDYNVNVASAGTYVVNARVASPNSNTAFTIQKNGTTLATIAVPNTGGWQNWTTVTTNITVSAGVQTLRTYCTTGGFNINYINYTTGTVTPMPTPTSTPAPTPTPGGILFQTGLESGNTQPTWSDTIEVSSNVIGYLSGINPECGVRNGETTHTGTASLMFSGNDNNATSSFCYFKVFDVNIPITSTTKLTYWFYPQMELARGVAVDFVCTDGTTLRDSGAVDQNGILMHPGNSRGTINTWNQVICNVGQKLNGKTIDRILVGYDYGPSTGQFRGFIDDIQINN